MEARGSTPFKGDGGHISLAGLLLAAPPAMGVKIRHKKSVAVGNGSAFEKMKVC
jgi:hypothetical protein